MQDRTRGQGICVSKKKIFPSLRKIRRENTRGAYAEPRPRAPEDCSQTKQGEEGEKHEYPY